MQNLSFLGLKRVVHRYFLLSTVILASCVSPAYGVQLDFTNLEGDLTNGDPTTGQGATMKFTDVVPDSGLDLDLIITVVDSYQANNTNNNKVVNGNEGQINIKQNTSTTFEFQLVETGTNTPFTVSEVEFGVMDIDRQGAEIITLYTSANYEVSPNTELDIITSMDKVEFKAKSTSTPKIDNPTDATMLDSTQQQYAANFIFYDISRFYLGYEYTTGGGPGRNYFFAGDVTIDNPVTMYADVPFEFSPGLGLLLSGGGLLGIRYLKQRRQQQKLDIAEN